MSQFPTRPQFVQQNWWRCTFCGGQYPSEQERDIHMANNCTNSPTPIAEPQPTSSIRPPMRKANTFSHPDEGQYYPNQEPPPNYGYGYQNSPTLQPPYNIQQPTPPRHIYSQRPSIPTPIHQSQATQPWGQPSSLRGYAPPPVQEDTGQGGYSGGNRGRSLPETPPEVPRMPAPAPSSRIPQPRNNTQPLPLSGRTGMETWDEGAAQVNRRTSDTQEPATHISYPMPPAEPGTSPLTKVSSPVTPSGDKAKVTIIWKKEIPTLERDITYLDNIEDAVNLKWNDPKAFFQGNATFSIGEHTGNIVFPSSGEMHSVQSFEVRKKGMQMGMITLKLVGVKTPEKAESKLPQPSGIPKVRKSDSEEAKNGNVPPMTDKEKRGVKEQLAKANILVKAKEDKIQKMQEEIQILNEAHETFKNDKQKTKREMVKLDEQLIGQMELLSGFRTFGRPEEQTLREENENLKSQLEKLQKQPISGDMDPTQGDELLAAKEQIDDLKSHYSSKDDELNRINKELEELVNKNNELQREVNRSGEECKELTEANERIKKMNEKGQNENSEEMKMKLNDLEIKKAELEDHIQQLEKEKGEIIHQNQEQINDLKSSLEQSEKKFTEKEREVQEIEDLKLRVENELNQARIEFNEKTESSKDSETYKRKIEQLTKDNSELDMSVQILSEKNKKYKQEHSKVTLELQDANTKHLEMQENLEKSISEAEIKSTTEIKELNESKQKQETESKALKDQVQLLTKQNQENRKTSGQLQNELAGRDEELTKLRKQTEENEENKQVRDELEVKLKGLNEELEQQKSDYDDLNHTLREAREELEGKKNEFEVITMESTKDKGNMQDKYFQMEKEKQDLQEQIEGLHTLINTLKQNTGDMKFKLDEVEKEKDKNKTEKNKFEKQLTDERIQKEEERNSIEKLEIELKCEKEGLAIHKQLIRKLNEDIASQATGQTIIKLREELEQANEFKSKFEDKLREMSKEIADRDAQIQQLYKKIGNIQVDTHFQETDFPQSYSDSNLDRNVFSVQSEKGQAKVGVTKISADKPQRAEGGNTIIPISNPTGKSPIKIKYRSANIFVVKLKAFPDPTKHARKQIVCTVKRSYELGTLVGIYEVQVKVGRKTPKTWYVGIRLNEPLGDSDGAYQGVQHFKCEPNHGYFSPFEDVYVPVA